MIKVLIIDDAAFMRLIIKDILEKNNFEVVAEAENGKVGLIKYKENKPDIVTMDITMPEMNGIEALKEILKYDSKAKVIMVSALGQESTVKEAILSGAKAFILKPFKEVDVIQTLSRVIGG